MLSLIDLHYKLTNEQTFDKKFSNLWYNEKDDCLEIYHSETSTYISLNKAGQILNVFCNSVKEPKTEQLDLVGNSLNFKEFPFESKIVYNRRKDQGWYEILGFIDNKGLYQKVSKENLITFYSYFNKKRDVDFLNFLNFLVKHKNYINQFKLSGNFFESHNVWIQFGDFKITLSLSLNFGNSSTLSVHVDYKEKKLILKDEEFGLLNNILNEFDSNKLSKETLIHLSLSGDISWKKINKIEDSIFEVLIKYNKSVKGKYKFIFNFKDQKVESLETRSKTFIPKTLLEYNITFREVILQNQESLKDQP